MKTGSMVVKVSDKEISTKEMKTGEISSMPYGMAVWSTGIGTRPVIMDFMKQIGQVCFTSENKVLLDIMTLLWLLVFFFFQLLKLVFYLCLLLPLTNVSSFKQGNRRVLATDEWLRVEGCDSVYALGDCATINQRKVMVPLLFYCILTHNINQ